MTFKKVHIGEMAYEDMRDVALFILSVSRPSHAERYLDEIETELNTLSYMATALPTPAYGYPRRFHPEAKMMKLHNKPLCAVFHIEGEYVVVDRIIHSSMITY